jgi:uncharacterized membrane protein HdeD (DUF308 family)
MRRDAHFWMVMLIRGLLALIVGSMILVIPDMARTLLLRPLAVAIAVLGLATYGVLDSALILISSFMAESRTARVVLLAQGTVGVLIGLLLLFVVFEKVRLEWFLLLAALQAAYAGIGELMVARHSGTRAISRWNNAAGTVALVASAIYLILILGFAVRLNPDHITWLVYGYLVAFGIAQCTTAARMLYADRSLFLGPEPADCR